MNLPGKFITVEGGEGCGKSTQAKLLFEALNNAGIPAILTREPGGTDGAEQIRNLLVKGETGKWDKITETLLYFAARRDHLEKLIKPSLERGEWIICDRFTDSTVAYQGYGHGVKLDVIKGMHKLTLGDFYPDMTMVFDIDVDVGIKRAHDREKKVSGEKEDRYERMGGIFHKNVRRGFIEIAKADNKRCVVIDASATIERVHNSVLMHFNTHFKSTVHELTTAQIFKITHHA